MTCRRNTGDNGWKLEQTNTRERYKCKTGVMLINYGYKCENEREETV